jgi:MFS transporter, MHS family, proline/betaine transporter
MSSHGARRRLAAESIGNFIENYDFAVFGFSVPILALYFFPGNDHTASILSTFAAYAAALFARPVGGLIFGHIADESVVLRCSPRRYGSWPEF